jgi:hypothetical protein
MYAINQSYATMAGYIERDATQKGTRISDPQLRQQARKSAAAVETTGALGACSERDVEAIKQKGATHPPGVCAERDDGKNESKALQLAQQAAQRGRGPATPENRRTR